METTHLNLNVCASPKTEEEQTAADQEVGRILRSSAAAQKATRTSLSPARSRPTSALSGTSERSHFSYVSGVASKIPPPPTIQGVKGDTNEELGVGKSDSSVIELSGSDTGSGATGKRKRGRPRLDPNADPNVGDGYLARIRRREENKERRREEEERKREEGITDPTVVPSHSARSLRKEKALEKEVTEDCEREPAIEVVARIEGAVSEIDKATDCSNHLKGSIVSTIRKALVTIRMAARTLVERVTNTEVGVAAEEVAALRKEVYYLKLRCEAASRREEIRGVGETKEPKVPSPPLEGKDTSGGTVAGQPSRKKRRTYILPSSGSSMEDLPFSESRSGSGEERKKSKKKKKRTTTVAAGGETAGEEWPGLPGMSGTGPLPPVFRPPIKGYAKVLKDPPPAENKASGDADLFSFIGTQISRLRDAQESLSLGRYDEAGRILMSAPLDRPFPPTPDPAGEPLFPVFDDRENSKRKKKRKKKGANGSPFVLENVVGEPVEGKRATRGIEAPISPTYQPSKYAGVAASQTAPSLTALENGDSDPWPSARDRKEEKWRNQLRYEEELELRTQWQQLRSQQQLLEEETAQKLRRMRELQQRQEQGLERLQQRYQPQQQQQQQKQQEEQQQQPWRQPRQQQRRQRQRQRRQQQQQEQLLQNYLPQLQRAPPQIMGRQPLQQRQQQQQQQQWRQQQRQQRQQHQQQRRPSRSGGGVPVPRRRPPKTSAVSLTCPSGQYEETMRLAMQKVDIKGLGIESVRPRQGETGCLLMEVSGADSAAKADALALQMREALKDLEGVRVARPRKTAEVRVRDLIPSATPGDVVGALAAVGECDPTHIRVGAKRPAPGGLGTIWAQCPLEATNKIVRAGKITVGWMVARVELLPGRPLRCFKCLERGHVRQNCPNEVDRSDVCFRCGEPGHQARGCTAPSRCPLCAEAGRPSNHSAGGAACAAPPRRRRGNMPRATVSKTSGRIAERAHPSSAERVVPETTQQMEVAEEEDAIESRSTEMPREKRVPRIMGTQRFSPGRPPVLITRVDAQLGDSMRAGLEGPDASAS